MRGKRKRLLSALVYLFLCLYAVFTLLPIYWVFVTSVKPAAEVESFPPTLLPHTFSLEHYEFVFMKTRVVRGILNSLLVTLAVTAISLVSASLAGYALARFHFPGKGVISAAVLGLYLIPPVVNVIPLFLLLRSLRLLNTLWALILAYQGLVLPLLTFLLRNYFEGIPKELEESALVDGCTRLGALLRVTLPLSVPGLSTAAIFAFIFSWNEFIFALLLIFSDELKTFQLTLMEFVKLYRIDWGALTAAMVIGMAPVLFFLVIAQRYLIAGLLGGAIKR